MGSNNKKKTTEQYTQEVFDLCGDEFKVLGEYKGNKIKIEMYHKTCGRTFMIKPNHFLMRKRCSLCAIEYRNNNAHNKKTEQDFLNEFRSAGLEEEYEYVGGFCGYQKKLKLLHKKCGKIWEVTPCNVLRNVRCGYCMKSHSKREEKIANYIEETFSQYTILRNKRVHDSNGKSWEIDIIVKELNIGFEYNGAYWHSVDNHKNNYHKEKFNVMKENGITLFFLWEQWSQEFCIDIVDTILRQGSLPLKFYYPYIRYDNSFLYINKDLYPIKPYINSNWECVGDILISDDVKTKEHPTGSFCIYNSGYWIYKIKAL